MTDIDRAKLRLAPKDPGIFKRCGCTEVDATGKRRELGKRCPKLVKLRFDKTTGALKVDEQGRALWDWDPKHGNWGIQVDVAAAPGSGKERQRIRKVDPEWKTITDAKHARGEILAKGKTAKNRKVSAGALTVGEYLARWIEGRRKIRRATRVSYQGHIDNYLVPYLGEIKLRDLDVSAISNMFTALEERNVEIRKSLETAPRGRRGEVLTAKQRAEGVRRERRKVIGPASMQRLRATLRKAINDALKEGLYVGTNPASLVELASGHAPRPQLWTTETEARWRETGQVPVSTMVWRPEQCGKFLDTAEGDRLYNLFLLASCTGMRRGELCGLRWSDVDLDAGRIDIRVQLTLVDGVVEEGPTKSDAGQRSVPLDPTLVAMFKAHRKRQREDRLRWGELWVDSGRVFVRENGDALNPDVVSDRFRAIAERAGLPPVRLHAMRSGAATMALAAGVAMKTVSEMLGHSNEAITSKVYTAVSDELKREAVKSIGALIPRRGSTEAAG